MPTFYSSQPTSLDSWHRVDDILKQINTIQFLEVLDYTDLDDSKIILNCVRKLMKN